MGADNHPTVKVGDDDGEQSANSDSSRGAESVSGSEPNREIPSVNGHALADLEGVEAAFDYLKKDYNGGDIGRDLEGERVLVTARARRFQHLAHLLDVHASEASPVYVADVYATHDGRQRVELAEE